MEEVAWRILIDGEMPARPPGTAVLFIGGPSLGLGLRRFCTTLGVVRGTMLLWCGVEMPAPLVDKTHR